MVELFFADKCSLSVSAGGGGNGCVSFLREKFIAAGPPNGGDGGNGGSIYIQAVSGETSLHKLARRGTIKAGRGQNGQGKGKRWPARKRRVNSSTCWDSGQGIVKTRSACGRRGEQDA